MGGSGGTCTECEEKQAAQVSRKVSSDQGSVDRPALVDDVVASPGRPLDDSVRSWIEPRAGRSFAGVRVHSDSRAAESARAVSALAYTVDRHVVFGEGQYQPSTQAGRKLIAHELAHVVQQSESGGGNLAMPAAKTVVPADHPSEAAADRMADALTSPATPVPAAGAAPPGAISRVATSGSLHCTTGTHGAPASALSILQSTELFTSLGVMLANADLNLLRMDIVLPGLGAGGGYTMPTNNQRVTNYQNRFGLPPRVGAGRFQDRLGGATYPSQAEALYHEADKLSDRFDRISDYFSNTTIDYRCIGGPTTVGNCNGHCNNRTATSCLGEDRIMLCPDFWTGYSPGGRSYLLIHEGAHMTFNIWHAHNFRHADCYAAFASDAANGGWVGGPACQP
jgi:hypothetical protein